MILIHFHKTSKIPPTFPHVLKYYRQEMPLVGTWYLVFQIKTVVYQTCTAPQSFGKICTHPSIQIQTSKGNITCLSKRYSNILNTLMRQMGGLFLDLFVNMVPSPTHTKLESLKICQDLEALFPTFTTL